MKAIGEIRPPGDKSISHRCVLFSALAEGDTHIQGLLESDDVQSSCAAVQSLGIEVSRTGETWVIQGGRPQEPRQVIDAGNSGTTARLLCGILASIHGVSIITGDSSLVRRPMARVITPLERMGASCLARSGSYLPVAIKGGSLRGISYEMDVASAQVKSALIIAGLNAEGTTRVHEPVLSRDHTELMLQYLGVSLKKDGNTIEIRGPQKIHAQDFVVPGDPSSAAFPAVWAAATPGSQVLIKDVCLNPTRIAFLSVLQRMGAQIHTENTRQSCGEYVGDILVTGGDLTGTTIEGHEIPALIDEIPVLAVAASCAHGTTVIQGASELRVKETDRISALIHGFSALGAHIEELQDGMIITGPLQFSPGKVTTFSDHRIAMAFSILSRISDITIDLDDHRCVGISYPGFFEAMESIA